MNKGDIISEEALKIHYFLLNSGFTHHEGLSIDKGNGYYEVTLPYYIKNNLEVTLDIYGRAFTVKRGDVIIFELNNKSEVVDELYNDWTVYSIGDEITLDSIMNFFREEKLRDLFNNG